MIDLLFRRASMFVGGGETPLPYDAEIEYLESDGTQYINTGIRPLYSTDVISVDIYPLATGYPFGSGSKLQVQRGSSGGIYSAMWTANTKIATNDRVVLKCENGKMYAHVYGSSDISEITMSSSDNITYAAMLFARNSNNTNYDIADARIYSFSIYREGVALIDMIPVRVGQVGYMYDKVSGQLFGNDGTGDFILGNDK